MTHVPNSFAGRFGTDQVPFDDAPDNPRITYERMTRENIGDIVRKKLMRGVFCFKRDMNTVLAQLAADRMHVVVSAGATSAGAATTLDFGYGWSFLGFTPTSLSPSIMRLDFEYYKEVPAAFSIGAIPGLSFVETSNSLALKYNNVVLKSWDSSNATITKGLEFQCYVTKRTRQIGTTNFTWFDAAASMFFDDVRIESCVASQADFMKDPITDDDVSEGDPRVFNRLRREIYWEASEDAVTLMWWGKIWMKFDLE